MATITRLTILVVLLTKMLLLATLQYVKVDKKWMLGNDFYKKTVAGSSFFCTGNFFCHLLSTSIFFLCLMLLYVQTKDKKMWAWNSLCATFLLHHYFRYKQLFFPHTYLLAFLNIHIYVYIVTLFSQYFNFFLIKEWHWIEKVTACTGKMAVNLFVNMQKEVSRCWLR